MNATDKKIFDLLNENVELKAPDNFTLNVMQAVENYELSKKPTIQLNYFIPAITLISILLSIAVFYFFDNSIFQNANNYLVVISNIFLNQFKWVNAYLADVIVLAKNNTFIIGIAFSIIALLAFDKIFLSKKLSINMFSFV